MLKKNRYTGLDVGNSTVKAVTIAEEKDVYTVTNIGIAPLPPGVMEDGLIVDPEKVASAIQDALAMGDIKDRNVYLALPGSSFISRELEMPSMPLNEIREALQWEAEEYLPYDVNDAILDFIVLEEKEENTDVLLVAAQKETVQNFVKPIQLAKLKPQCLNIEPFAHHALLNHNVDIHGENLAIIDIGASFTTIILLKGQRLELIRNLSTGSSDFTTALEEAFEFSTERAEEIKLMAGDIEDDTTLTSEGIPYVNIKEVLMQQTRTLLDEISRSFNYFQVQQRGETFNQLFLTGNGSLMAGLEDTLFSELAVPVQILDPLANFELSRSFDSSILKNVTSLSVSVGLILCELMEL